MGLIRFLVLILLIWAVLHLLRGKPSRRRPSRPDSTHPEEMIKDPQCGTYVPRSQAVTLTRGGETICFCSEQCREQFQRLHP